MARALHGISRPVRDGQRPAVSRAQRAHAALAGARAPVQPASARCATEDRDRQRCSHLWKIDCVGFERGKELESSKEILMKRRDLFRNSLAVSGLAALGALVRGARRVYAAPGPPAEF